MKQITANSKTFTLSDTTTLKQFLDELHIQINWVVVERNGEPVARESFSTLHLQNGDCLEIVTPIAGG